MKRRSGAKRQRRRNKVNLTGLSGAKSNEWNNKKNTYKAFNECREIKDSKGNVVRREWTRYSITPGSCRMGRVITTFQDGGWHGTPETYPVPERAKRGDIVEICKGVKCVEPTGKKMYHVPKVVKGLLVDDPPVWRVAGKFGRVGRFRIVRSG